MLRAFAFFAYLICAAGALLGQVTPQRIRVSPGIADGMLVQRTEVHYPAEARAAEVQGTVVLQIVIGKDGSVRSVRLINGDPTLAPAAIESVTQWKYKPYVLNGEPVEVDTQVSVPFSLPDARKPQRIRVSEGVSQGLLLQKVDPVYPEAARAAHAHGPVVLKTVIGKDGTVEKVEAVSGDPALVPAAMDAVKQWKYRPYLLNDTPLFVETTVTVNFTEGVTPKKDKSTR